MRLHKKIKQRKKTLKQSFYLAYIVRLFHTTFSADTFLRNIIAYTSPSGFHEVVIIVRYSFLLFL
jgi:hypothetical protein